MSLAKALAVVGVLAIAGGLGYRYYQQHGLPRLPTSPSPTSVQTTPSSSTPIVGFTPPNLDTTWQTYRNGTLKFLLQFPTKGVYAPKFTVKVVNANDPALKEGCYDAIGGGNVEHLTLQGVDFCRVTHALNPPSVAIDTEYWTTKKDTRVAVITFTKKYSTNTSTFDVNTYRQFVGSLMSTFQYPDSTSTKP